MTLAKLIDELNPQQKQAATTTVQNCLVLAGAGCGKTKTIVARAAYLIDQGLPAQQIQILTFTRRAASEIITRVEQHMGEQAKGLRASTFHTFCMYLLRRNPRAFGLTQFSIIDRDDQLLMFRLLRGKDKGNVLPKAAELCDLYSYARNTKTKLSDALIEQLPQAVEYKAQITELMKAYEQRKHVGDDAQSIYGFRGADFENIHHFKARVPDAEVLTLEMNYRSTQGILDLSNWLLDQSQIGYDKHLQAYRGKGLKPQLHILSNEFEEANWIIQDLNRRHLQGAAWAEHMVLLRSGFSGRYLEGALIAANIPYRFIGGVKLLESAHVKDVLSLLRVSVNPQDDLAWMRFLTLWDGVGDVGASRLASDFLQQDNLLGCLEKLKKFSKVPTQIAMIFQQLLDLQHLVKQSLEMALNALQEQLEKNYQNKDWSRRSHLIKTLSH